MSPIAQNQGHENPKTAEPSKGDPRESSDPTPSAIPDYMFFNCYWDKGLSKFGHLGTDTALRHWKSETGFVVEEELRRHATETTLTTMCYQINRPPRGRINGIGLAALRYHRLIPGLRRSPEQETAALKQRRAAWQQERAGDNFDGDLENVSVKRTGCLPTDRRQGIAQRARSRPGPSRQTMPRQPQQTQAPPHGHETSQPGPSERAFSEAYGEPNGSGPPDQSRQTLEPASEPEDVEVDDTQGKGKGRAGDVGTGRLPFYDPTEEEHVGPGDAAVSQEGGQSVYLYRKGKGRAQPISLVKKTTGGSAIEHADQAEAEGSGSRSGTVGATQATAPATREPLMSSGVSGVMHAPPRLQPRHGRSLRRRPGLSPGDLRDQAMDPIGEVHLDDDSVFDDLPVIEGVQAPETNPPPWAPEDQARQRQDYLMECFQGDPESPSREEASQPQFLGNP